MCPISLIDSMRGESSILYLWIRKLKPLHDQSKMKRLPEQVRLGGLCCSLMKEMPRSLALMTAQLSRIKFRSFLFRGILFRSRSAKH